MGTLGDDDQVIDRVTVDERLPRRVPVFAVITVALLGLNLRIALSSVPPVLLDLGLSRAGGSALTATPLLCFGLAAFMVPALRTRLGEERALFAALVMLFAGLVVRPMWAGSALFPGTILAAIGVAVMNVLMPSLVRRRFPNHVGAMTANYLLWLTAGGALAAGLTVPIQNGLGGSAFAALGVWAIPAGIALLFWWPEARRAPQRPSSTGRVPKVRLGANMLAWQVTLFFGLQSLVYQSLLAWLPAIYRDRGLEPAVAGGLLAVLNTTSLAGNFLMPIIASRMRDQRPGVVFTLAVTTIGLVGLLLAPTSTAVVWATVLGVGTSGGFSLALLLIVLRGGDAQNAAGLSSMAQGYGYLVSACGPFTIGLLRGLTGGWSLSLVVLTGVVAITAILGMGAARSRTVVG